MEEINKVLADIKNGKGIPKEVTKPSNNGDNHPGIRIEKFTKNDNKETKK